MIKKYIVRLNDEERQACTDVIKHRKGSSQKVRRAQILLKADADGPAWTDARIAEAFNCRIQTIENLRKRLDTESFELALEGLKRETPPRQPLLAGEEEAKLFAMRLGKPLAGYRRTNQLILRLPRSAGHGSRRRGLPRTDKKHLVIAGAAADPVGQPRGRPAWRRGAQRLRKTLPKLQNGNYRLGSHPTLQIPPFDGKKCKPLTMVDNGA